ncbi:MAG TPA: sigma-70 family RNA polymerase sigma factor [Tepidisphaeraceae bacterium]|nr:sigma-70 family RNA polymerase sigma factor [Tepidisphaeraceae bacterium]
MTMQSKHDWELLREYAISGSQPAFEELVKRHVDLVYSSALRQVKDVHLAEDVSQAVFMVLSKKAASLAAQKPGVLAGWLFKVTRYTAANAIKTQRRRRIHEAEVMTNTPAQVQPDEDEQWREMAPHLDDAMNDLPAADRNVLLMRFFSNRSHQEIATVLNISEDASKKRLSRAIDRLRTLLEHRGVTASATIGNVLLAKAVHNAPAHLSTACAKLDGTSAAAILAKGALLTMTISKLKTAAVVAIVILLLGSAGAVAVQQIMHKKTEAAVNVQTTSPRISAPQAAKKITISGIVRDLDGKPLAGAEVKLATTILNAIVPVAVYSDQPRDAARKTTTGPDGAFQFTVADAPCYIVIKHDHGYAQVTREQLAANPQITIQSWARIEGIAKIGSKPASGITIHATRFPDWNNPYQMLLNHSQTVQTDPTGHFVFPRVAPGNTWICRKTHAPWDICEAFQFVPTEPGKTVQASLGGSGRPVVGRVTVPQGSDEKIEWKLDRSGGFSAALMQTAFPQILPELPNTMSWEEKRVLMEQWDKTTPGQQYRRSGYGLSFWIEPDGSFRIEDVPPGIHRLSIQVQRDETGSATEQIAEIELPLKVDLPNGPQTDEPFDLGNVTLNIIPRLRIGRPAPSFAVHDLDGNEVKLTDFAGKFVLLVIWSEQRRPSEDDIGFIKLAHERNAKSGKLAILTIEMTHDAAAAKKLTHDTGLEEIARPCLGQFSRGPLRDSFAKDILPREYFQLPNLITLIDPEGNVAAKNLSGAKIELSVYQAIFAR